MPSICGVMVHTHRDGDYFRWYHQGEPLILLKEGFEAKPEAIVKLLNLVTQTTVGVAYGDWLGNGIRHYAEPFKRDRLLISPFEPPLLVVANRAALELESVLYQNLAPLEFYDLMLRITEKAVAYHLPEVVAEGNIQKPNNFQEAYGKVIEKAHQRAS